MPTPLRLGPLMAIALLAVGATCALAADLPPRWHPKPWRPPVLAAAPAAFAPASAGMMIARDPETGTWGMPSRIDDLVLSEAEENMLSRSSVGLVPVTLPDGSVMLDLQGRFQEFSIARIGPDGRVHHECVSHAGEAHTLLRTPPAPVTAGEER